MKEFTKNMDLLYFETFNDFKIEGSFEKDWQAISPKLRKQNYLKFGYSHFNIYYTAILIMLAGLCIFLSSSNEQKGKDQKQIKNSLINQAIPVNINKTKSNTEFLEMTKEVKSADRSTNKVKTIPNRQLKENDSSLTFTTEKVKPVSITDSLINDSAATNELHTTIVRTKKKIYKITVVYENPVVVNDTVKLFREDN